MNGLYLALLILYNILNVFSFNQKESPVTTSPVHVEQAETSDHSWNDLQKAALANDYTKVKQLIHDGAQVPPSILIDMSFIVSNQQSDPEMISFLIEHGADVNAQCQLTQYTPLFFAQDPYVVHCLLNYGANPNIPNRYGTTCKQVWQEAHHEPYKLKILKLHEHLNAYYHQDMKNSVTANIFIHAFLQCVQGKPELLEQILIQEPQDNNKRNRSKTLKSRFEPGMLKHGTLKDFILPELEKQLELKRKKELQHN